MRREKSIVKKIRTPILQHNKELLFTSTGTYRLNVDFFAGAGEITDAQQKKLVNAYAFGFNGQEKVDEVKGSGNHNTALFWEYDTRLGRRWNLDPVKKPWQSDYACFSNSPIWKIDPNGDDDFFNADGSFSHRTKEGTRIFIQTASGNVLYSQLPMNNMHNRQILANVTGYYANQLGIKISQVGIANHPKNTAKGDGTIAYASGNDIYVNAKGGVNPLLDDYNNLSSALRHEKDHTDKRHGFNESSNIAHAEVYLTQIKDPTFSKTTSDFKKGIAGAVSKYLKDAAYDEMQSGNADFTALTSLIADFNKQSKTTGYTFSLIQTKSGYSNPEDYEYEVYVTPVKPTKK